MENSSMSILLKTKNGNYIETADDDLVIGGKTPTPAGVFQFIKVQDEKVALKSLGTKKYVTFSDGKIKVDSFGIGPESIMGVMTSDNGEIGFIAPNGKFWEIIGKDRFTANSEKFDMEHAFSIEDASQELISILWGDLIHQKLFDDARIIINRLQDRIPGAPELYKFITEHVAKFRLGIYEADYKIPYWDQPTGIEQGIYRNHFYDPKTEKNYWGDMYYTAKNMVLDLFNIARRYEDKEMKAYNLGLAFHFLCDLTVPVHTSNYIALPPHWNHSKYEEQADREYDLFRGKVEALDVPDVLLKYDLEVFLRYRVAIFSYHLFDKYLRNAPSPWTPELIRSTFPELFGDLNKCYAPRCAAAFLLYFRNFV